jgi:hypothetical protein
VETVVKFRSSVQIVAELAVNLVSKTPFKQSKQSVTQHKE